MVLQKLYRHFLTSLKEIYSDSEAGIITDWVFETVANCTKTDVLINPQQQLNNETIQPLNNALKKLLHHMPVQYVLGEAWFYKMKLKVSPSVLIPRPETEELVLEITNHLSEHTAANALDIGTGSGCIAIALKKNVPQITITAIDKSSEALQIAFENASIQETPITFLSLDFLEENSWKGLSKFDIIVSNPPYIPFNEKQLMDKNVTAHEPHIALFVPTESPLIFYEKIALFGKTHLNKRGKIFMETHEAFAGEVSLLFEKNNYKSNIKKDMYGKQRMVIATHCP